MCIAILNSKEGGLIPKERLKVCWKNNDDGAGYAFAEKGRLTVVKEMKSFDKFYKQYELDRSKRPNSNFLIHFRIKTHGKINLENCHPFLLGQEMAFIHNGMITGYGNKDFSDTVEFGKAVLEKLPKGWERNEGIVKMMEGAIGFSKLVFLRRNGEAFIIGEKRGDWETDMNWYSNGSWKAYKPVSYGVTHYGGYGNYGGSYSSGNNYFSNSNPDWKSRWKYDNQLKMWVEKDEDKKKKEEGVLSPAWDGDYDNYSSFDDFVDRAGKRAERKELCTTCDGELFTKDEKTYGACVKCLKEYNIYTGK